MNRNVLKEFGLTENEISIFLVLVKKGSLSVTSIAKETGLNRPYVYYALERLLEKGYISEVREKGKKNFQALEFNRIISLEEHKIDLLRNLGEDIEKLRDEQKEEVSVEVLKGKYAVRNLFKRFLVEVKPKQEVLYIGVDEEKMEGIEPIFLHRLLVFMKEQKIKERVILKKGGKKLGYAPTTTYRFLDKSLIGNTMKMIYQDTVIELIYGEPIYVVVMKNQELADTARKQFEVFWKIAKK
ncbi:MAG: helix-turn-helix domain-containing protein [Nanoarchaeota archaeon]|nr:helix-turn-helix domain-containing protein [Nanoarchaeota archaeon]